MARDPAWLRKLAEAYFDSSKHQDLTPEDDDPLEAGYDREQSVIWQVYNLVDELEECWRFIQIAAQLPLSRGELGVLGAGLLEDLMDAHGSKYLDRAEATAKERVAMQTAVDAVWTMSMDPYVARAFKTIQSHGGKRG